MITKEKMEFRMYIQSSEEFKKVLANYDIFLFDIFGVIWDGAAKIAGVDEVLSWVKSLGKTVIVLSNAPNESPDIEKQFKSIGLVKNLHYDFIVSSGDAAKNILFSNGNIFPGKKDCKNCFIVGKVLDDNFLEGTRYCKVYDVAAADFVYLGFPQISEGEYKKLKEKNGGNFEVFLSPMYKDVWYDLMDASVFTNVLEECKKYNLPMFSDCADMVAAQPDAKTNEVHYVIRQGTLVGMYKNMSCQVVEVCKPYSNVYSYAFDLAKKENKFPNDPKILMIGDTIETDILGATNATNDIGVKVDGMLTLCGVSGRAYNKDIGQIENYCLDNGLCLNYIIDSLGVVL